MAALAEYGGEYRNIMEVVESDYVRHLREAAGVERGEPFAPEVYEQLLPLDEFLRGRRLQRREVVSCEFVVEADGKDISPYEIHMMRLRDKVDLLGAMLSFTRAGARVWVQMVGGRPLSALTERECRRLIRDCLKKLIR